MLVGLAKNRKSAHGDGPRAAVNDPLPDFDRWREYLEGGTVQAIAPPPGSEFPDQAGWEGVTG
eukprot:6371707-Alexandrium_andersonii.AAC.1